MKTKKPIIIAYGDYRDFLRERFQYEKEKKAAFSFQFCATRLGTSRSYLKLLTEKKRHATIDKLSLLCDLFKLNEFERQYLTILFLACVSKDKKIVVYFLEVLGRMRIRLKYSGTHEGNIAASDRELVFRRWLNMAVHSLARMEGFLPDVDWICAKLTGHPPVAREEVSQVIQELLDSGSIKQKENGKWYPAEFVFRAPDVFDGDHFKVYKVGFHLADKILDDATKVSPRHFQMMSIGLDEKNREEAFRLYIEFRDRLIALSKATEKPERVFFVMNSIFPLSK